VAVQWYTGCWPAQHAEIQCSLAGDKAELALGPAQSAHSSMAVSAWMLSGPAKSMSVAVVAIVVGIAAHMQRAGRSLC
jgi:hypothetical protein